MKRILCSISLFSHKLLTQPLILTCKTWELLVCLVHELSVNTVSYTSSTKFTQNSQFTLFFHQNSSLESSFLVYFGIQSHKTLSLASSEEKTANWGCSRGDLRLQTFLVDTHQESQNKWLFQIFMTVKIRDVMQVSVSPLKPCTHTHTHARVAKRRLTVTQQHSCNNTACSVCVCAYVVVLTALNVTSWKQTCT